MRKYKCYLGLVIKFKEKHLKTKKVGKAQRFHVKLLKEKKIKKGHTVTETI